MHAEESFELVDPKLSESKWMLFNVDSKGKIVFIHLCWLFKYFLFVGYYRVNYDSNLWKEITTVLKLQNFGGLSDINRAQLLDDVMNLARANELEYSIALDLATYLENETSYYPWYSAFKSLGYLKRRLGEKQYLTVRICKILY